LTPNTSRSRRLRVTVGPTQAEALRLLAVESGLSLAQEAGALLRLGIRTAWRRYATLYGLREVPRVSADVLAEMDRKLGIDNKPAEGQLVIDDLAARYARAEAWERSLHRDDDEFYTLHDSHTRPPWGPEELESDG